MGFIKDAKVVTSGDTLKPLQGAKVILPSQESTTKPVESNSFFDTAYQYFPGVAIGDFIYSKFTSPTIEDKQKANTIVMDKSPTKSGGLSEDEYNNKLFNSLSRGISFQTGAEKTVSDYQALESLKKIGVQPISTVNEQGQTVTKFKSTDLQFTDEQKNEINSEKESLIAAYDKQIQELNESISPIRWGDYGATAAITRLSSLFGDRTSDLFKSEAQVDVENQLRKQIKQLEEDKQIIANTITDKLGNTKSEVLKTNPETRVKSTQPLEGMDFNNIESIQYNFTSANSDLEKSNALLKLASNPITPIDSAIKSSFILEYTERGLEMMYASNPNELALKKQTLLQGVFKPNQRPTVEQQEAMFVSAKSEQKELVSTSKNLSDEKQSIDANISKYLEYGKKGNKLTPEQNEELKRLSALSSNLQTNIYLQEDRIKTLQSFINNNSETYKGFLEEQEKYDRITELVPNTTAFIQGVKEVVSLPYKTAKLEYTLLAGEERNTLSNLKDSPEFRYKQDEQLKTLKEIEGVSLVDEEGNFKFDYHLPGLIYNTTKTAGESFVLGSFMLGTKALVFAPIEKKVAQWATAGTLESLGAGNVYSGTASYLAKQTAKTLLMGTGTEAAFASPLYLAESLVGSVTPSVMFYGDEMIQNQLKQGLTMNQSKVVGVLLSGVEGLSERFFPNEMNFVKSLIAKGEITSLKELAENTVYKKAVQETYKQMTGKTLSEKAFKILTSSGQFIKGAVPVGLEETAEEIAGLAITDVFINPIAKSFNPNYEGEELTARAITNTAIATMATMLPMMGQAGISKISQYNQAQKSAQFTVGQNSTPYYNMTFSLFKEGAISEEEFQRRSQLINKHKENYKQAISQAITKPFVNSYTEDQFKNYTFSIFDKISSIDNLKKSVIDNPEDEKVFQIYEQENLNLQTLLEKGLFKTEEERIQNTQNSLDFYLSSKNIDTFTKKEAESTIQKLKSYEQIELDENLKAKYKEKIENLYKKIEDLNQKEVESQKTPEQKAEENNQKGQITIQRPSLPSLNIEFNTPYYLSTIDDVSVEGAKISKRPLVTVIQDNGDGTVKLSSDGEVIDIPFEDLGKYKFTKESTVREWKKSNSPEAFVFEHENDVFSYEFGKATDAREKTVKGRIQYNPLNKTVDFVYKDKQGNVQKYTLSKSDLKSVNKGKLKYVRTLETESEFNAKQSKMSESASKTDFEQLQNQALQRLQFITDFITKKQEELKATKSFISKVEDSLLDTEIEIEKLQKQLDQKETLKTKKGATRVDIQKLFDKLNQLQNTQRQLQDILNQYEQQKQDIENQIEYTKQYEDAEFESKKSLVDQLIEDQFNLETQLEQVNDVISNLRNLISGIGNTISKIAKTVYNLVSGFENKYGRERLTSFDANSLQELKEIDKIFSQEYPDIQTFLQKNPEYFKNLLRFNELVNENLDKIDLSEKQISDLKQSLKANTDIAKRIQDKIRYQEELISEAQKAQEQFKENKNVQKIQSIAEQIFESQKPFETENETLDNEEDSKLVSQESDKIELSDFFSTTTSGTNFQGLNLNNLQVLRFQNFLNNVENSSIYSLLAITKDNAKQYGLEDVLFSDDKTTNKTDNQEDNDIKLVVVIKDNTGTIHFVNENGEILEKGTQNKDNIVTTSLRKASVKWSDGEKAYVNKLKQTEEEENKLVQQLEATHAKLRQDIINAVKSGATAVFSIKYISRGRNTQEGQPNSAIGTVIPASVNLSSVQIIQIPQAKEGKTAPITYMGNKAIPMPVGRPVLSHNQHFEFLNSRKFTPQEVNKFMSVFKALYDAYKTGDKKNQEILLKYLQKTLYFRRPEKVSKLTNKPQETPIGRSQIWISNENNTVFLNLSENFRIPFNFESGNTQALLTVQAFFQGKDNKGIFHNVDNQGLIGESFTEVVSVSKDGKLETREWKSYQEYLLSNKYPDGSERPVEEIPLTVNINPSTPNTPNKAGRYIVFDNQSNQTVVSAAKQEVVQQTEKQNIPQPTVQIDENTQFEETVSKEQDPTKLEVNKIYRWKLVKDGVEKFIDFTLNDKKFIKVIASNWGASFEQLGLSLNKYVIKGEKKPGTVVIFELTPIQSKQSFTPVKSTEDLAAWAGVAKTSTTPTEPEKPVEFATPEEILAAFLPVDNTNDGDKFAYRKATKTQYKLENLEAAKKWFEERFPQIEFRLIYGLIDGKAWGRLKDKIVTLSDVAEEGTIYHEAFEVVHKYMLKPMQIKALYREFKNRKGSFTDYETGLSVQYSKASDYQIKEQLAEEYREYQLTGKKWEGEYNKNSLFRKIKSLVDFILNGLKNPESIQEVFDNITNGAYKDFVIPIQTENLNSEYKAADIKLTNPEFFNDLMKSMTNIMFEALNDQNRSIPEVLTKNYDLKAEQDLIKSKIDAFYGGQAAKNIIDKFSKQGFVSTFNNAEQFKSLMFTLSKSIPSLYSNLYNYSVDNKLSQQQILEKVYDLFSSYDYIDKNWEGKEGLAAQHIDYLAKYGLELVESEEEINENEQSDENKNQNEYERDTLKLNRKLNANTEIKLLLATLREMEWVKSDQPFFVVNTERERKPKLNSLLMSNLVDYNKTIISLLYKLSPATTFDEMVEILKQEGLHNPSIDQLLLKLKINTPTNQLTEFDVDLRNKFFTSMNNMLVKYKKLILDPQTKTGSSVDLNEENAFNIIKTKWVNTTRANNKLFKTSKEGKITLNKSILSIDTIKNLDDAILFLNSLGYEYNVDLNRLNSEERDVLLKSSLNLFKVITTNDPELIMYNSPLVRENLNDLAELYIKYTDNYAEPQHLNIDREPVQNIILHNFIGSLMKSFNMSKTFDDFIARIPQLNPNSENNAWLSFSQILSSNSDFFRDGKRSKKLSIEILEGSEVRESNKGVATSKLSLIDRIAQEFAFNLQGIYYILTPADTKTEWGINFGHFVTQSQSKDNTFILNLFKNYLKAEILTAQQGNPEKLQNVEKAKGSLRFFKDILKDVELDLAISPEEAIRQKEQEVNQAILNWIDNNINQTYQEFVSSNIITPYTKSEDSELSFTPMEEIGKEGTNKLSILFAPSNFIKDGLTEEEIKDLIRFNNLNYTFNIFEQHKLFWGDPAQWKDITKRTKSFTSGRNLSVNSASYFNDFYNQKDNTLTYLDENDNPQTIQLEPGDFGYVHYDDTIKTVTYQDVIVENSTLEGYDDINEADAEGWSFPLGTREIRRRSNTWTQAEEEQFQWDNALCRKDNNLYPEGEKGKKLREYDNYLISQGNPYLNKAKAGEKTATLNVLKPIYSGYKDGNTATVNLDKLSLAALNWRLVKGTQAEQFYLEHFKKGTTYVKVESANKVGITSPTPLYTNEGRLNIQFSHEKLNFKYFGIQVETSTQKNKTTLGTQLTKLITMNVDKIKNKLLVDNNSRFLSALKNMSKDSIFKEFGIKESIINGQKVFEFDNFDIIADMIQRELNNRDATENLKEAMKINPLTGKFYLKWDMVIGSERLEAILTSIIDNNILRPKMFGGQMPQIASTLFERKPRIVKKTIKGKPVFTSNELKFYEDADGKRYCEVYLPFYMKEFIQKGVELSISDLPEDLKYGVGFRIPTQNTNSIENFKIKGFLPVEYGNSIVIPSEITKKSGSDFDIDKLNIYLYNYKVNQKTNKPEKIKFLDDSNSTVKERYKKIQKAQNFYEFFNSKEGYDYFKAAQDTGSTDLISDIFGEDLTDNRIDITKSYDENLELVKQAAETEKQELPTIEEFAKLAIEMQNSRKAVENAYIDNIRDILELPEMFEYLIKPNSADPLKEQAKKINNLYGENKETKSSDYYLSRLNNAKDRHAFLVGKDAVGIGASQQTQNAIGQIVDLAFEEFKNKFHLDFPTNSEDLGEGKTKYSLSNKVDKTGKTISDTISMFIDAFVDIAKDPYIFDINGNLDTASIYITGVRLGIPLPLLTRWFNQPVIREYIKLYQQNKSISTDLKGEKLKKKEIIAKLADQFQLGEIKERNTDFTESELEGYIKNFVESQKENTDTSQEFKDSQAILLNQFIQLQDLSWDLFRFGQAINLDTTRTVSFESIRLKMAKIATALDGRFAPYVRQVFRDTFIGTIYQAKLDLLESIKPLYLTESDKARSVLNPILNNIYNSIGKQDVLEEEAKKLRKHFITYLLHTIPVKIGNNQQPVLLTSYINDLLLSDKNIAIRLRNLQNAQEEGKLPKNFFTKNLLGVIPAFVGKKQKTHNIRSLRKMSDKIDSDLATSDFNNLANHPQTEGFLFDLIKTSLLQSGLNQDPFSISQLIPNNIFQEIASQIESYFNNANITDILDGFIDSYYKNQWYNTDLVPKATNKKTTIDKNTGQQKDRAVKWVDGYKPFLEYFVESDTSERPIFSKEARNPYLLVKTLQEDIDGRPLFEKYEREQMAKKGDFSFLKTTLYKRLEILNPETGRMDIPLAKKYYFKNRETGLDVNGYIILYYPVDAYGERFNLVEHYSTPQPSKINENQKLIKSTNLYNHLKSVNKMSDRFVFQHIFPQLQEDNEDFITVLDATLNEQEVFKSQEESLSLPEKVEEQKLSYKDWANKVVGRFLATNEVLRKNQIEDFNNTVDLLISGLLKVATFASEDLKNRQYLPFINRLKENGFKEVDGKPWLFTKNGLSPEGLYQEYLNTFGQSLPETKEEVQLSKEQSEAIDFVFEQSPEIKELFKGNKVLYQQYLDTILPDSKVEEIDNSLYISVLNQLEQENIIEKDCTGGGKLKAKDGISGKFTKGSQWEIYEIFEGKSHKQGGIEINIKNNQINFTNKNGSIKAKYGLVISKDS